MMIDLRNSLSLPKPASRSKAVALVTLLLAFAAGCGDTEGPARAPVSGNVTLGTAPLESGVIRFVPVDGTEGPMTTATITDSRYAMSASNGPVIGTHRVEIEATGYLGFPPDDEEAAQRALQAHGGRLPPSPVPAYYSGRRSPLSAEILPEGHENLDFQLDLRSPTAGRR